MGQKDKNVKYKIQPSNQKNVKVVKNPDSYKSLNVSWQFNLMDFDFDYGWNKVIKGFNFTQNLKEELLLELAEIENSDILYTVIDELPLKYFDSLEDFSRKLNSIENFNNQHFSCIISKLKENFFWDELFPKLKDIESKTWAEFEIETFGKNNKSKHHWVSVKLIIKQAKDRLVELRLDDNDEIFSIRLTGTNRIWGFRTHNYFKLLWFDYDHDICPSLKK